MVNLAELVINGIAAVAAVAAAVIALILATRDRRERRDERHAAERAQARLVLIDIGDSQSAVYRSIDVHNFGAQPVLDVAVEGVTYRGQTGPVRWNARHDSELIRALPPERDGSTPNALVGEIVRVSDGVSIALSEANDGNQRAYVGYPPASFITVTVRFTDASGNIWTTDTDGQLTRVGTAG